jgi:beta-lactamase regulating signal transducer with metallopeptidase domain
MTWWLNTAWNNAVLVSVLAGIAWVVSRWSARPALAHALWLLVLAKLVTPPLVSLPVPAAWPQIDSPLMTEGGARILAAIWILGSIAVGSVLVVRGVRFNTLIKEHGRVSGDVTNRARILADRLGMTRIPRVVLLDARTTPLIWGLGSTSTLVFPFELWKVSPPSHRDAMLLHELAHIRRGDPWTRLLEALAAVLYWWHPVSWIARRQIAIYEEESCDATAVAAFTAARREYAEALISAIDFASRSAPAPLLATGVRSTEDLARRLRGIMRPAPQTLSKRTQAFLCVASLFLLPLSPMPEADHHATDAGRTSEATPAASRN